jgi:hypothetical protein
MSKCLRGDVGINLIAKSFKMLKRKSLLLLMKKQLQYEKAYVVKTNGEFNLKRIEMKSAIIDIILILFQKTSQFQDN